MLTFSHNELCEHIWASIVFGLSWFWYGLINLLVALNADLEAMIETKLSSIIFAIACNIWYFVSLDFHHIKISKSRD